MLAYLFGLISQFKFITLTNSLSFAASARAADDPTIPTQTPQAKLESPEIDSTALCPMI